MVDVNCGDHFAIYTIIESCWTPETIVVSSGNYILKKKFKKSLYTIFWQHKHQLS